MQAASGLSDMRKLELLASKLAGSLTTLSLAYAAKEMIFIVYKIRALINKTFLNKMGFLNRIKNGNKNSRR